MTNQTPESVIAEVIEYHADTIGSHWDGCYKHHAVCLAVKLRDMLREPGELAALAAVERVRARLGDILPDWSDSGVIAVADILAALDGAPEPEWEWGVCRTATGNCWPVEDIHEAREAAVDGYHIVHRRPFTPWLPVEGESDGA